MSKPHEIVVGVANGLVDGAKSVGGTVAGALDRPPSDLGGPQGIHHVPHRYLNGVADSLKTFLNGIDNALDQPSEQFGIPPDLGQGRGLPGPRLWRR